MNSGVVMEVVSTTDAGVTDGAIVLMDLTRSNAVREIYTVCPSPPIPAPRPKNSHCIQWRRSGRELKGNIVLVAEFLAVGKL